MLRVRATPYPDMAYKDSRLLSGSIADTGQNVEKRGYDPIACLHVLSPCLAYVYRTMLLPPPSHFDRDEEGSRLGEEEFKK